MITQLQTDWPSKAREVLAALWKAFACARDLKIDPWEFSLPLLHLLDLGVDKSDLRWLVLNGYVTFRDLARRDQPGTNVVGGIDPRFIITETGAAAAGQGGKAADWPSSGSSNSAEGFASCRQMPYWDRDCRVLYLGRQIVKRFKQPSPNQEIIILTFDEEGWPCRIDDPLSPILDIDPKHRLHDTIKCLNRHQENRLLRFFGNGSGDGVRWEILLADTLPIPSDASPRLRVAA